MCGSSGDGHDDRLGRDGRSLTPSLDALAAEGQNYRRAFAQANETLFSHTAVFTGRYPSDLGSLDYESFRLDPSVPTLAGALALRGWRTEGYVAGGHLAPVFGLGSGFDHYQSGEPFSTFQQTLPEALLALERLSETSEPSPCTLHQASKDSRQNHSRLNIVWGTFAEPRPKQAQMHPVPK